MVRQQINFYLKIDRPQRDWLGAHNILLACAAVLCVLLLTAGVMGYSLSGKKEQSVSLGEQQQLLLDRVEQLRAKRDRLSDPGPVQAKLRQVRSQLAMKQAVMASLNNISLTQQGGFSKYLQALSQQHLDGLWITGIEVHQGGQHLALLGKTRKPKLVPEYLTLLGQEMAFAGQQFDLFRITQPLTQTITQSIKQSIKQAEKQRGLHDFEVRSRVNTGQSEQGSDAVVNTGVGKR